jgi:hypothetical protein
MEYHNNNHFDIRHIKEITDIKPKTISVIFFQVFYVTNTGYFPIFVRKAEIPIKHFSIKKVGENKHISLKKQSLESYLNSFKWANIDVNHFTTPQYKEHLLTLFTFYDTLIEEVNSISVIQSNITAFKELFISYMVLDRK